jgi:ribokinase
LKILNFGSMNIDYVYEVDNFVKPGETKLSKNLRIFSGGKGLNQSIALAKAGTSLYHACFIGQDGLFLKEQLQNEGVDTDFIEYVDSKTGHAIIQVDSQGKNCILLHGGANQLITMEYVDRVLSYFSKDDFLILQNEIKLLDYIVDCAYKKGMRIVLNPSPINEELKKCSLEKVSYFLLNEIEGKELTDETEPERIIEKMHSLYPTSAVVLTLGENGSVYKDKLLTFTQEIYKVGVVDTTAAGDTFTGYFIAALFSGMTVPDCLKRASIASALSVSRNGAAASIPYKKEVDDIIGSMGLL